MGNETSFNIITIIIVIWIHCGWGAEVEEIRKVEKGAITWCWKKEQVCEQLGTMCALPTEAVSTKTSMKIDYEGILK